MDYNKLKFRASRAKRYLEEFDYSTLDQSTDSTIIDSIKRWLSMQSNEVRGVAQVGFFCLTGGNPLQFVIYESGLSGIIKSWEEDVNRINRIAFTFITEVIEQSRKGYEKLHTTYVYDSALYSDTHTEGV